MSGADKKKNEPDRKVFEVHTGIFSLGKEKK